MTTLRRTGSFVAMHWAGTMCPPEGFPEKLKQHRFRTIENAASEEKSFGWVTPCDPSGDSFDLEDMSAGGSAYWLRVRFDAKRLPQKWVQRHMDAATKAKGRQLSARERRELKEDLREKLLPRVLPGTANIDVLVRHGAAQVLVFGTPKVASEVISGLWLATFGVALEELGPFQLACRSAGPHVGVGALQKLEPTRWPFQKGGVA